jgi:signal recognition particle subunit SRP19
MRKKDGYIIWPEYFDSSKPRRWRRISRSLAVEKPTLEELKEAATRAGFTVTVEPAAKHPSFWFESSGRILIHATQKKNVLVKAIAIQLRKIREERERSRPRRR